MATVLVDTDVYSYLTGNNSKRIAQFRPYVEGHTIAVSFITVGEVYAGFRKKIDKGEWPESHLEKLEERLKLVVVVPYDVEICRTYGKLRHSLTNPDGSHRNMSDNDLWIAATAIRHGIKLLTNNRKHFEGVPRLELTP